MAIALVFSIRQTPNYVHHQFLFWNCKLTRFPNYEFPVHLRWKEYSCAVSTSAKNFVRKRDLVMKFSRERLASTWVWAGEGTLLSPLCLHVLFIKKKGHISLMKFETNHLMNSIAAVYCEVYFEGYS